MARYSAEAVVLKFVNFRDADKIYTLFAKDLGKISATGMGVRKISSRRGGNLDTLNHIIVGISESERGFKTITEVKTLSSFKKLKESLKNSVKGFYITELVFKLLEEGQEHNDIFELLVSTLEKLEKHLNNEASRVNAFEIKLMELLGYGMYLDRCAKTGKKYSENWEVIKFSPSVGGLVCVDNVPGIEVSKEVADLLFELKTKDKISKSLLKDKEVVKEADRLVKMYVKDVLEGKISTERVFGEI